MIFFLRRCALLTHKFVGVSGLKQMEEEKNFKSEFPPCNVEYKADPGTTRFWCTTVRIVDFPGISDDSLNFPAIRGNQPRLGWLSHPTLQPGHQSLQLRLR
jgi:hypothetical protein